MTTLRGDGEIGFEGEKLFQKNELGTKHNSDTFLKGVTRKHLDIMGLTSCCTYFLEALNFSFL